MDRRKAIGREIKRARLRKGVSQVKLATEMAKWLGHPIDQSQISDWENGKNMPDIENAVAASKVLGVSLDELVFGEKALFDSLADEVERRANARKNRGEKPGNHR